jgi:excisionase family DNA binding protein
MDSMEDIIRRIVREEIDAAFKTAAAGVGHHVVGENPQRLYSVASVADLLGVSADYVYDRIRAGEIAVVELGSARHKQRVSSEALRRFIDLRTTGSS